MTQTQAIIIGKIRAASLIIEQVECDLSNAKAGDDHTDRLLAAIEANIKSLIKSMESMSIQDE